MRLTGFVALIFAALGNLAVVTAVLNTTETALTALERREIVADILADIEDAVDCTACEVRTIFL